MFFLVTQTLKKLNVLNFKNPAKFLASFKAIFRTQL